MSLLENHVPVVRFNGLNTAKAVSMTGPVTVNQQGTTTTALAATGNQALNAATGSLFTISPTADLSLTITGAVAGQRITIVVTQTTTTSRTLTLSTGFKATGTLATGTTASRAFVLNFISDGTNVLEVSRTAAITI